MHPYPLDPVDRTLLNALQRDGRATVGDLAEAVYKAAANGRCLLAQAPTHLTSADFNLDGNADVAVSHAAASFSYLTGKGTLVGAPFNAAATVTLSTTMGTSIIAAPFNTDSDQLPDVVTTSTNTNNLSISINSCQ